MRTAETKRKTAETDIFVKLNVDGTGVSSIDTGCAFLDHMLTLFSKHSRIDLEVTCKGDVEVDYHHTTEDVGNCIGFALSYAMGSTASAVRGIRRYGDTILPMDEALIMTALDWSGRGHLEYNVDIPSEKVGDFDTELCEEFWRAFVRGAGALRGGGMTLHIRQLAGTNSHHIIEGIFKSVARSLGTALSKDERFKDDIPSTKGVI